MFFYSPPIPLSRIRYQEKEPNERELEELYIFFIFSGKKIKRTKGSKFNLLSAHKECHFFRV